MKIQVTEISERDAYYVHQNIIIGETFETKSLRKSGDGWSAGEVIVLNDITSIARSYKPGENLSFYEVKYEVL